MEMEDQYGMADLRQLMKNGSSSSTPYFPTMPQHQQDHLLLSGLHRNLTHAGNHHGQNHYEMMMLAGGGRPHQVTHEMLPHGSLHHEFHTNDSTTTAATTTTTTSAGGGGGAAAGGTSSGTLSGLETDVGCIGSGDGSTGRWPRQETLCLLEIRSRLDHKFKEANQKGPLWDEVSRIMSEEHGYQRSGKKCREKFENLYKYYKKTKEGKAGRQDGKHYRFFRQLEALYGPETTINVPISLPESHLISCQNLPFHSAINNNSSSHQANNNEEALFQTPKLCDSLSLSNSSEFDISSSDDSVEKSKRRRGGGGGSRRNWKAKIKDFIDAQMRKLMEKQEAWLEKMMRTIEHKEQERVYREEEWRKQEADRLEREHKFWANERAWIEARDAALMEALNKLTGKENVNIENDINSGGGAAQSWPESEITRLIQLRISMESRFQQSGSTSEEVLWEEIAAKMGYDHHRKSAIMCKEKWDNINNYLKKNKDGDDDDINKKRKENNSRRSTSSCYYQNNNDHNEISVYNNPGGLIGERGVPEMLSLVQPNNDGSSSSPSNVSNGGGNNTVQESCFRFIMGDNGDHHHHHHHNLWENYGVKLNNQGGN